MSEPLARQQARRDGTYLKPLYHYFRVRAEEPWGEELLTQRERHYQATGRREPRRS